MNLFRTISPNWRNQAITLRTPGAFQKRSRRGARKLLILRYRNCPTCGFQKDLVLERGEQWVQLLKHSAGSEAREELMKRHDSRCLGRLSSPDREVWVATHDDEPVHCQILQLELVEDIGLMLF